MWALVWGQHTTDSETKKGLRHFYFVECLYRLLLLLMLVIILRLAPRPHEKAHLISAIWR